MPKRKQYVFGERRVGVRGLGGLGALSLGRSRKSPDRPGAQPAGSLGRAGESPRPGSCWPRSAETPGQQRAEPYCFPLRPVLVLVPIHGSCFLICIFFCMDMPSSGEQGFLFFMGVSGQTLLFQIPCQVVRFRCVIAVSLES